MALRFLVDECSRSKAFWNAIITHNESNENQSIDAIRVGDMGAPACGTDDESLVKWATTNGRVIISQDRNTLAAIHDAIISRGHETPGILFMRDGASYTDLIESIWLIAHAAEPEFLSCRCEWIPLN